MNTYITLLILGFVSETFCKIESLPEESPKALTFRGNLDPRCPLVNDKYKTVHLPHERDCTLFYKCDWGTAILQNCPRGLHFNSKLSVCDYPANANCDNGGSVTRTTTVRSETTTPPRVEVPGRDCPLINDYDETIHLPHENDCTLFYKCDWGTAILQRCPPGLHFNSQLSVCDYPANANCDNGGSVTRTTTVRSETTTPPRVEVPGRDCPLINDYDETIHLPHENDCTLFYKCDWGTAILQNCPPGLHFNNIKSVCDYPENANCK
jgi:Chitin binding Peritrophin-A domain